MTTIKLQSETLRDTLNILGKSINGKCSMPILDCVFVAPSDRVNRIRLRAGGMGDNSEFIETNINCIVVNNFTDPICIPYSWLKEVANMDGTINFGWDDVSDSIEARTLGMNVHGSYQDPEPYPKALSEAEYPEMMQYTYDKDDLVNTLSTATYATATDQIRQIMTGVYMDGAEKGFTTIAATDGRKLFKRTLVTPDGGLSMILSKKTIQLLQAMPGNILTIIRGRKACNAEENYKKDKEKYDQAWEQNNIAVAAWEADGRQGKKPTLDLIEPKRERYEDYEYSPVVSASCGGYILEFNPIDGRFPNYAAVFPKCGHGILANRDALLSAFKSAGAFANQSSGLLKVTFGKDIKISGRDNDYNFGSSISVPAFGYDDVEVTIGMSAKYTLEHISRLKGTNVQLEFISPDRPIVLSGADEMTKMLVMPMMIDA